MRRMEKMVGKMGKSGLFGKGGWAANVRFAVEGGCVLWLPDA